MAAGRAGVILVRPGLFNFFSPHWPGRSFRAGQGGYPALASAIIQQGYSKIQRQKLCPAWRLKCRRGRGIMTADRSSRRSVSHKMFRPLEGRKRAIPATNPHRSQRWCDVMIVIIRSLTALAGEWMRRGGHI